jgi:hypothetical protein
MAIDAASPPDFESEIGSDGIKSLTVDNWRSVDPTPALLVELDPRAGYPRPITPERSAQYFLEPQLDSNVPAQIRTMFNVARGVMLYGSFFCPLYTLGTEQLYRVADAATWLRCRQLGKPLPAGRPEREMFAERVRWLSLDPPTPEFLAGWRALREGLSRVVGVLEA